MTEQQAKDVIRKLFAMLPTAATYYQKNVAHDQKIGVFDAWAKVLMKYEPEAADAALAALVAGATNNPAATTYPVQALVDEIKAKQPRPKQDISPCDRSPRDSNMLESYLAGVAARDQPLRLQKIIEGVL